MLEFLNSHTPLLYLTQSLWRDEAFSILMSRTSFLEVIKLTAQDFNPPLYYLILHFWMLIFGQSEIAVRMLSFIFHICLVYVIYKFAKYLKLSKNTTYYLLLITFLNPMLLYFSFEARMYSLLALFATASMYTFLTKNWKWYILFSALGLWTQPFMMFVLMSQGVYLLITKSLTKKHILYFLSIFLFFLPWVPVVLYQLSRSGPMWIWPIDLTTVTTILGNVFTGYDGTPWGFWDHMKILSTIIILASVFVFWKTFKSKEKSQKEFIKLVLIWLYLPTILVLIISYFKPIYVNRYVIFLTVAEILITISAITIIKNKFINVLLSIFYLLFLVGFNIWFPPLHQKTNIRLTIQEIKSLYKPGDMILSETPLTFFETTYYLEDKFPVFLYNPNRTLVPSYVGSNLITTDKMVYNLPKAPKRAFLIHNDASFELVYQK